MLFWAVSAPSHGGSRSTQLVSSPREPTSSCFFQSFFLKCCSPMNGKVNVKWMHSVRIWNKASSHSQTPQRWCTERHPVCVWCCLRGRLQGFMSLQALLCGRLSCLCVPASPLLSSALCIDGSVPVIDGTLLLWCSRFNGAWQSKGKQHATREGT